MKTVCTMESKQVECMAASHSYAVGPLMPRRTRMVVTDFVHGGYVCDGTQWMKVRLLCKTCRRETGWYDGAKPVVYCDHHYDEHSPIEA